MSHPRIDWMEGAPCAEDPEAFALGVHRISDADRRRLEAAKRICLSRCKVAEQCLKYALDNNIRGGVWGGLGDSQRQAFLRKQREKRRGAVEAGVSTTKR